MLTRIRSLFSRTRSQVVSARSLAFESLDDRKLLAADLACMPTSDIANDDAMIGRETVTNYHAATASALDTINVRTRVLRGGLDSPDASAAAYGYGGTPELSDVTAQWGNNTYFVSGTVTDNDLTGATATIDGITVDLNATSTGEFSVEISGEFSENVELIVTDMNGNTATQTIIVD